jgi:hypothetical protein
VDKIVAAAIIAEMGVDMSVFAYSRVFSQLGSWERSVSRRQGIGR